MRRMYFRMHGKQKRKEGVDGMFELNGSRILLTRGDTGVLTIETSSDHEFTEDDKALFTARRKSGGLLVEMILQPEADGTVQIPFTSDLSDNWTPGDYKWDVRYVIGAVMENDRIVDGQEVITPMAPGTLTIAEAVGKV